MVDMAQRGLIANGTKNGGKRSRTIEEKRERRQVFQSKEGKERRQVFHSKEGKGRKESERALKIHSLLLYLSIPSNFTSPSHGPGPFIAPLTHVSVYKVPHFSIKISFII